ncbi:MAG: Uncharacterized protein FD126_92 [Elusimicrobia bacterium]|nr:MAG: Uncharacterized protein FD126_92 [Elusimicrobiota bacterium]
MGWLSALPRFALLLAIKGLSRLCFRFEVEWVGAPQPEPFHDARVGVLLNHTSLFEPILVALFPLGWLWRVARHGLMPGADATLDRPVAGRLFRSLVPQAVSVTRSRDRTWTDFTSRVAEEAVVLISPEGRMKRRTGFDKHGRPMTLRGGIVDVLERKSSGTILLVYSEGLHHVQAPGEGFPNLFVRVRARLEEIDLADYKRAMGHGTPEFRARVLADLERRRDAHCPWPAG